MICKAGFGCLGGMEDPTAEKDSCRSLDALRWPGDAARPAPIGGIGAMPIALSFEASLGTVEV